MVRTAPRLLALAGCLEHDRYPGFVNQRTFAKKKLVVFSSRLQFHLCAEPSLLSFCALNDTHDLSFFWLPQYWRASVLIAWRCRVCGWAGRSPHTKYSHLDHHVEGGFSLRWSVIGLLLQLIHIDFGITFDQGKYLITPEMVPFRLTRGRGVAALLP